MVDALEARFALKVTRQTVNTHVVLDIRDLAMDFGWWCRGNGSFDGEAADDPGGGEL
ncbi:hypothetical protein DVH05_007197 [Phytophthora capsici]|nr:hypothetical protein DVH05_007197 [Phytophthora capsici]